MRAGWLAPSFARGHDEWVFKRLIWWSTGAVAGALGTEWAKRKFKRTVKRHASKVAPGAVASTVRTAVKNAVTDGRGAARDREQQLNDRFGRK